MSESFKKIKQRLMIRAILFGAAVGVSCGLAAAGIVLLALKLNAVTINAGYYVLIAVLTAAITGVPLFFALRPNDRKVAKKLDKEYSLNEKVQTMLAYRNEEADIVRLQREDTEKQLSALPKRKIGWNNSLKGGFFGGFLWNNVLRYCAAPVVALAVFIPAVAIPMRAVPADGNENDDYSLSQFQVTALKQLIEEVQKSSFEGSLKLSVTDSLEKLLEDVSQTESQTFMKISVTNTVTAVDYTLSAANSYADICAQLVKYEKSKPISTAIVGGVAVYGTTGLTVNTYGKVEQIETRLNGLVSARTESVLSSLREDFALAQNEGLDAVVAAYVEAIQTSLIDSKVEGEDALYRSLSGFTDSLGVLSGYLASGQYTESFIQARIESAFEAMKRDTASAVTVQSYNRMMNEFVRNRLWEIFGLSDADLPTMKDEELIRGEQGGSGSGGSGDGEQNNDDKTENGGYGSGGDAYGSDDKIYDPATDSIVNYGGILQEEYYAKMREQLESGDYPEDLKNAIKAYFDLLLGKAQQNNGEN